MLPSLQCPTEKILAVQESILDCIVDPDSYQENHVHPRDISALLSGRSYLLFI